MSWTRYCSRTPRRLLFSSKQVQTCVHRLKSQNFQSFPVVEVEKDGRNQTKVVSMEELLGKQKNKLPLRDLRILSTAAGRNQCSILPRPLSDCFILEIETIRLICWKDRCILIENESKIQNRFLQELLSSLAFGTRRTEELNSVLRIYQESECVENVEFEQKVLESALSVTVSKFERHIRLVKPAVDLLLQQIAADPNSAMLRRMLAVKKSLGDFETNVTNVSKVIQALLSNDNDMAGLYLTNKERKVDQHEEVELLLEFYLADLDEIHSQIKIIKEMIEDTNQFIGAHLDSLRNRMIRMSLFMEMGTLSIGSGALIAGIFGMNLTHGLEADPVAFYVTCGGISTVVLVILTKFRARYKQLWADKSSAHSFKVLKNFLTYVDDLEDLVSSTNKEITEKEFKEVLDKLTGDKVPAEEAEFIFQMFDRNKDRKLNRTTELKI